MIAQGMRPTDYATSLLDVARRALRAGGPAHALAMAPWLYPQGTDNQISAGMNEALLLAIGMTDPVTDLSLLDYLRPLGQSGTLNPA